MIIKISKNECPVKKRDGSLWYPEERKQKLYKTVD